MKTATDFSQNIKKQLTNTLYVVSVDGNTNVLYMNAITGECNLVFDTRIAIDNVMIKYHNTIEKGMPKQVIICSENAVRAYSEIKKLEIKDKKLFIENCLCEFNNDEQVHFIY